MNTLDEQLLDFAVKQGFLNGTQAHEARAAVDASQRAGQPVQLPVLLRDRYLRPEHLPLMSQAYTRLQQAPADPSDGEQTLEFTAPLAHPAPTQAYGQTPTRAFGEAPSPQQQPSAVAQATPPGGLPAQHPTRAGGPPPAAAASPVHATRPPEPPPTDDQVTLVPPSVGGESGSVPAPSRSLEELKPGSQVDRYEILKELARGGMGAVFVAKHVDLGRKVALKVMLAGDEATQRDLERFLREARATATLQHPHIVGVHDVRDDEGLWFIVMSLIEGESLQAQIEREGPLDLERAARLTYALALALEYAHRKGILHRDMKPHNVLLTPQGQPKITDFGLAKLAAQRKVVLAPPSAEDAERLKDAASQFEGLDNSMSLTVDGFALGTPGYMPPEQATGDGERVDARSDVYGLGATLYAMLTGRPPFSGPAPYNVITAVLTRDPKPPSALRPDVDEDLEAIVLRCLSKDPNERYASAQELAEDLKAYFDPADEFDDQADFALEPPTSSQAEQLLLKGVAVTLPLLVIGMLVLLWSSSSTPTPPPAVADTATPDPQPTPPPAPTVDPDPTPTPTPTVDPDPSVTPDPAVPDPVVPDPVVPDPVVSDPAIPDPAVPANLLTRLAPVFTLLDTNGEIASALGQALAPDVTPPLSVTSADLLHTTVESLPEPIEPLAWVLLGRVYMERFDDHPRALEAFDHALEHHAKLGEAGPSVIAARAVCLRHAGREREARDAFTTALSFVNPKPPGWLFHRGEANLALGDLDDALTDFRAVLREDPSFSGAWLPVLDILAHQDDRGAFERAKRDALAAGLPPDLRAQIEALAFVEPPPTPPVTPEPTPPPVDAGDFDLHVTGLPPANRVEPAQWLRGLARTLQRQDTIYWRSSWDAALSEAIDRNVPILLVFNRHKHALEFRSQWEDPNLVETINSLAVAFLAEAEESHDEEERHLHVRFPTFPAGDPGAFCEFAPTVTCAEHNENFQRFQRSPSYHHDGKFNFTYILLPNGEIYAQSPNDDDPLDPAHNLTLNHRSAAAIRQEILEAYRTLDDSISAHALLKSTRAHEILRALDDLLDGEVKDPVEDIAGVIERNERDDDAPERWIADWGYLELGAILDRLIELHRSGERSGTDGLREIADDCRRELEDLDHNPLHRVVSELPPPPGESRGSNSSNQPGRRNDDPNGGDRPPRPGDPGFQPDRPRPGQGRPGRP